MNSFLRLWHLFLPGFLVVCGSARAQLVEWSEITPAFEGNPSNVSWESLTALDGKFYLTAVDGVSYLYESSDGLSWSRSIEFPNARYGIRKFTGESGSQFFLPERNTVVVRENSGVADTIELPATEFTVAFPSDGASGNGRVVVVGTYGNWRDETAWWVSSDDGLTYSFNALEKSTGVDVIEALTDIVFAEGKFVTVGFPGEIWHSTDGENWNRVAIPNVIKGNNEFVRRMHKLHYDGTHFYAFGTHLSVMRSDDGETWEVLHERNDRSYPLETLVVDGDYWHLGGSTGGQAWTPDGGDTWFSAFSNNKDFSNLTGGNGLFFADRYFATGNNLISFFSNIAFDWYPGGLPVVSYNNATWLAELNGNIFRGVTPRSVLDGSTDLGEGNFQHPWMGFFYKAAPQWIYHYYLGWCFVPNSQAADHAWLWNVPMGWIYLSEGQYPFFYHAASGHWGWHNEIDGSLYNTTLETYQSAGDFGSLPWVVNQDWLLGKTLNINDSAGSHSLRIDTPAQVTATFNVPGKSLTMGAGDAVTWFDSSFAASMPEGHRWTFDITDATLPGAGDRILLIVTFDDENGGTTQLTYTYLNGLIPTSGQNIFGTFTVSP